MFSPEDTIKFFDANEQHRPLTIRTNSLKARRSSLIQSLTARKVHVDPVGPWTKVGLKVYDSAVPVGATPEYLGGQYMIQSASSFIPVMALAPQQDEVILDMAAAPGGKTTYIGQLMRNTGTLYANDLRKDRCTSLVANIHRLGLTNAIVTNLDGKKLLGMLPKLDRVLLDAPCTGSGIMARDPSIKVKRGSKDFEEASKLQKELLMTAIDMVDANSKTGGYIVYSTCSVSIEEDECVVDHALRVRNVELVSFSSSVNFGVEGMTKYRERRFNPAMGHCRRFYPHVHNMDGFFVAKFKKISNKIPERSKKDRDHRVDGAATNWGEEKWVPEMMEQVMDFSAADAGAPTSSEKPAAGKRMKKRLFRQQQLAERAAKQAGEKAKVQATVGVVEGGAPAESRPRTGKRKGADNQIAGSKVAAAATGSGEATAPRKKKLVKKIKSSPPVEGTVDAPPAVAEAGAPSKKKRKKTSTS